MGSFNMRRKEVLMQMKEAIIRLEKQNKPIREMTETVRVSTSTIGKFLKRRRIEMAELKHQKAWKNMEDN